jgi:hypothetical protein
MRLYRLLLFTLLVVSMGTIIVVNAVSSADQYRENIALTATEIERFNIEIEQKLEVVRVRDDTASPTH